jgi:hypothetical protein
MVPSYLFHYSEVLFPRAGSGYGYTMIRTPTTSMFRALATILLAYNIFFDFGLFNIDQFMQKYSDLSRAVRHLISSLRPFQD